MPKETSTCTVIVWNEHQWELDAVMLQAVMCRVACHLPQAVLIDVYPQERVPADAAPYKHPGQIEWIMRIQYRGGGSLTVGCLQRTPESEVEFHS